MQPTPATLELGSRNDTKVILKTPQYGIAPGQAAVCYIDDRVIGGGWIKTTSQL